MKAHRWEQPVGLAILEALPRASVALANCIYAKHLTRFEDPRYLLFLHSYFPSNTCRALYMHYALGNAVLEYEELIH